MSSSGHKTVFVAGAGGAVGRVHCRLLLEHGWRVFGSTRSAETAAALAGLGVEPVIVDVFDEAAVIEAVVAAKPDVVSHQLTDLPKSFDPATLAPALERNARVRERGTAHLVKAAVLARVKRVVAQSIAFAYAPGPRPYLEDAPLDVRATDAVVARTARAVETLEALVLGGPFEGVVLRFGHFYGPRTWFSLPPGDGSVHVHAAADAACRALTKGVPGTYNVAEDDGFVSIARAVEQLGWDPAFRTAPP